MCDVPGLMFWGGLKSLKMEIDKDIDPKYKTIEMNPNPILEVMIGTGLPGCTK